MQRDTRHLTFLGYISLCVIFVLYGAGLWPVAVDALRQAAYKAFDVHLADRKRTEIAMSRKLSSQPVDVVAYHMRHDEDPSYWVWVIAEPRSGKSMTPRQQMATGPSAPRIRKRLVTSGWRWPQQWATADSLREGSR
jgi:hypothetical protein